VGLRRSPEWGLRQPGGASAPGTAGWTPAGRRRSKPSAQWHRRHSSGDASVRDPAPLDGALRLEAAALRPRRSPACLRVIAGRVATAGGGHRGGVGAVAGPHNWAARRLVRAEPPAAVPDAWVTSAPGVLSASPGATLTSGVAAFGLRRPATGARDRGALAIRALVCDARCDARRRITCRRRRREPASRRRTRPGRRPIAGPPGWRECFALAAAPLEAPALFTSTPAARRFWSTRSAFFVRADRLERHRSSDRFELPRAPCVRGSNARAALRSWEFLSSEISVCW